MWLGHGIGGGKSAQGGDRVRWVQGLDGERAGPEHRAEGLGTVAAGFSALEKVEIPNFPSVE